MRERGQVLPLMALLLAAIGALALGVAHLGRDAATQARAQTAADAAALAGAVEGRAAAQRFAEANGAEATDITTEPGLAEVRVSIGDRSAAARAEADLPREQLDGLAPGMIAAIHRAEQLLGTEIPIASGYRSYQQQLVLWNRRHVNPFPVARPGTSNHERGLAIDVPTWFLPGLLPVAAHAGLCRPLPMTDPVHFELCHPSGTR